MKLVEYISKQYFNCQMCTKQSKQAYLYNAKMFESMFPELKIENLTICETCAQRESGKKQWPNIKRTI